MKKTILLAVALVIAGMMITSATSMPVDISSSRLSSVEEKQETADVSMSIDQGSEETDGLFDWVFLRGLVFNPGENESSINALAINLYYIEITPQGINKGVVRLKTVSFRNGIFIKMSEIGLFGYTVHVSGFCYGGIEIQ